MFIEKCSHKFQTKNINLFQRQTKFSTRFDWHFSSPCSPFSRIILKFLSFVTDMSRRAKFNLLLMQFMHLPLLFIISSGMFVRNIMVYVQQWLHMMVVNSTKIISWMYPSLVSSQALQLFFFNLPQENRLLLTENDWSKTFIFFFFQNYRQCYFCGPECSESFLSEQINAFLSFPILHYRFLSCYTWHIAYNIAAISNDIWP